MCLGKWERTSWTNCSFPLTLLFCSFCGISRKLFLSSLQKQHRIDRFSSKFFSSESWNGNREPEAEHQGWQKGFKLKQLDNIMKQGSYLVTGEEKNEETPLNWLSCLLIYQHIAIAFLSPACFLQCWDTCTDAKKCSQENTFYVHLNNIH